jgi:hypothetical protein
LPDEPLGSTIENGLQLARKLRALFPTLPLVLNGLEALVL